MVTKETDFFLPNELNASAPPERRGVRRDHVRMMVLDRNSGAVRQDIFYHLEEYLSTGDVLVLNNSRTVPAILKTEDGIEVRLARRVNVHTWDALVVKEGVNTEGILRFSKTLSATIIDSGSSIPLTRIRFSKQGVELLEELYSIGEPIRYEYIQEPWTLDYYQTVFASEPGSVEMPSAGRAFSWQMLSSLKKKGVNITYLQLHTGLSYYLNDDLEHSPEQNWEEYHVPSETWRAINEAKASGHKVIAVGTTVVRALETAARTKMNSGSTNLYITENFDLQVADAIITGMHEPKASHLDMLCAFIKPDHLFQAYQFAIEEGYLWHEFGDMNLII